MEEYTCRVCMFLVYILSFVLMLMQIVGYSTAGWLKNGTSQGLFEFCNYSYIYTCCKTIDSYLVNSTTGIPDFIYITRGLHGLGVVGVIVSQFFAMYLIVNRKPIIKALIVWSCTGISILSGSSVYGLMYSSNNFTSEFSLSNSFWSCTVVGIAYTLSVLILFCFGLKRFRTRLPDKNSSSTAIPETNVFYVQRINPEFRTAEQIKNYLNIVEESRAQSGSSANRHGRHTTDYLGDAYRNQLYTPSYWMIYDKSRRLKDWSISTTNIILIPVSRDERNEIESLVSKTWDSRLHKHGKDANGLQELSYTNIKIIRIERVENPHLFEKYANNRAELFLKANKTGKFKRLEDIPIQNHGPIKTAKTCERILHTDMFPEVNEHYLFHGTTSDKINGIIANGFDCRMAQSASLGKGVYAAETPTKADQYADSKFNRDKETEKKMFLLRMCLGEMYIVNRPRKFKKPPCKVCYSDECIEEQHIASGHFDSVVADGAWIFREFVVYDRYKCYPEYLITYMRV